MKNFRLRGFAVAVAAVLSIGAAQAATLDGALFVAGEAVPIPGPSLSDAVGLAFTSGLIVTGATGDIAGAGIGFGSGGSIADFLFAGTPVDPFITVGPFTAVLNSVVFIEQSADFLELLGLATISGGGFDDTPMQFSLSADGAGSLFSYSATLTSTITVVPVPGALVLLASGLAALGFRRRS